MRSSDQLGEIIAGAIAVILIGVAAALAIMGRPDTNLGNAVPVIVAFYFAGRASNTAWTRRRRIENGGGHSPVASDGITED